MNIWEEYIKWVNNKNGLTWQEYYNLYVTKKWKRTSKKRNYQRNKDIIYNSTVSKRNDYKVGYELLTIDDGDLYLDENILKLSYEDKGYSSELYIDRLRPFNFITMEVDNGMNLVADIPNLILDAEFKIDNNGNLILKYG